MSDLKELPVNGLIEYLKESNRTQVVGQLNGDATKLDSITTKVDKELEKLESKTNSLEERIRDEESINATQGIRISTLESTLKEKDDCIKRLTTWQNKVNGALIILGVLFTLLLAVVGYYIRSVSSGPGI